MSVVERWYKEVWNEGKDESIDELLAEHAVVHGLVDAKGNPVLGRESFKEFYGQFRSALSDIDVRVEDVVHDESRSISVARCTVTATHTGDGLGIAPGNKPLHFSGMSWARLEGGQIVEAWNNFDFMTMMQQMQ